MTSNTKPSPVTISELAERLAALAKGIETKVSDALHEESGLRQLRIMCRAKLDDQDVACVEELAHLHGFLEDEEEMERPEVEEKGEEAA